MEQRGQEQQLTAEEKKAKASGLLATIQESLSSIANIDSAIEAEAFDDLRGKITEYKQCVSHSGEVILVYSQAFTAMESRLQKTAETGTLSFAHYHEFFHLLVAAMNYSRRARMAFREPIMLFDQYFLCFLTFAKGCDVMVESQWNGMMRTMTATSSALQAVDPSSLYVEFYREVFCEIEDRRSIQPRNFSQFILKLTLPEYQHNYQGLIKKVRDVCRLLLEIGNVPGAESIAFFANLQTEQGHADWKQYIDQLNNVLLPESLQGLLDSHPNTTSALLRMLQDKDREISELKGQVSALRDDLNELRMFVLGHQGEVAEASALVAPPRVVSVFKEGEDTGPPATDEGHSNSQLPPPGGY